MCEVILISHMKCQARPCWSKPRPALPNHHARSPLFWDITQHWVVIPYQHFGTTCWFQIHTAQLKLIEAMDLSII